MKQSLTQTSRDKTNTVGGSYQQEDATCYSSSAKLYLATAQQHSTHTPSHDRKLKLQNSSHSPCPFSFFGSSYKSYTMTYVTLVSSELVKQTLRNQQKFLGNLIMATFDFDYWWLTVSIEDSLTKALLKDWFKESGFTSRDALMRLDYQNFQPGLLLRSKGAILCAVKRLGEFSHGYFYHASFILNAAFFFIGV